MAPTPYMALPTEFDFDAWKKSRGIPLETKVFVVKGREYADMVKALVKRGWVENPDHMSPCFDLKLTCRIKDAFVTEL